MIAGLRPLHELFTFPGRTQRPSRRAVSRLALLVIVVATLGPSSANAAGDEVVILATGGASEYDKTVGAWVRNGDPALFIIDPTTLRIKSFLWHTGTHWQDLRISPTTGDLWGQYGSSTLERIDPVTFATIETGPIARDGIIHFDYGLDFAPDGTLWTIEVFGSPSSLVEVATTRDVYDRFPATFRTSLPGFGGNFPGELAFATDGTLFGSGFLTPDANRLYTVDTATGAGTLVGQIYPDDGNHHISALAFSPDGQLYAVDDPNVTRIVRVNLTDATPTLIGELGEIDTPDRRIVFDLLGMVFTRAGRVLVSGTVRDGGGSPMPGVTAAALGATAATDPGGHYVLDLSSDVYWLSPVDVAIAFSRSGCRLADATVALARSSLLGGADAALDAVGSLDACAAQILASFDAGLADGSLSGSGSGASADQRAQALRRMLELADRQLQAGHLAAACSQLLQALRRTDGLAPPPDFIEGPAAAELAARIQGLQSELGCRS